MFSTKRSIFLTLFVTVLFNSSGMAFYSYFPRFLLDFGLSRITIQLITTIIPFNSFIFPPLIGKLSDRFQNRYIFFVFGAIGMAFVFLSMHFFNNISYLIIGLFIFGFFSGCSMTSYVYYQELIVNDPKFISYYNAMVVMGWFLGSQIGGIFIEFFGISNLFILLVIISFLSIPFVLVIKEDRVIVLKNFEREISKRQGASNVLGRDEDPDISKSIYFALFFRNFGVRPLMAILTILMMFHIYNDIEIGFLIGINPLVQIVLMILIGRIISDKNVKLFMIIGYLLTAIIIFGYIFSIDFIGFLLYQIMVSFSYALFYSATHVYIAEKTTPDNKGKYIGYANSSFYLGSFLGGLFFSGLLSLNPDYYSIMWYMIMFPVLSALIILIKFPNFKANEIKNQTN